MLPERRPDIRISGAKQRNRRYSERGGQMGYARVVPDENAAFFYSLAEVSQTRMQKGLETALLAARAKFADQLIVGLTADQEKIVETTVKPIDQFHPLIEGPILARRTTTQMKAEPGEPTGLRSGGQVRDRVPQGQSKGPQHAGQMKDGVQVGRHPARGCDDLSYPGSR